MVIEDGLLGLNNAGHPTSHVDEAARWVTKDHYFLRQPFSPEATMAAFERYPSFAYRGSVPVGALAPN
jgi:hypothetical protein